ncbi:tetratricopeptide repeat protein [Pelagicoccus albus]|uniref:Tetratricopeptide repeat protein n=1 Tax=Pelagicoccus albus TaxID=415222 RepID=A0A7X1E936_9BACT|nr:hypothetical protein [Pelagicoccus albus]MBC2605392.1 hypothetical protein [Pelagicoccus albus]
MPSERDQILFKKSLTYANGYRELGMFDEALAELENIDEMLSCKNELLKMRLAILMEAQRWQEALPTAHRLAAKESSDPGNVVNLAYVTRRSSGIESAKTILEKAVKLFPEEAIIHYNLGCYACCTGDTETAMKYLIRSFRLDPEYLEMSQKDEDLKSIREWLKLNKSKSL